MELKNSILHTHPHIANEWHPTKNLDLEIEQISRGSNKIVWWLGKCGTAELPHEWQQKPNARTSSNQGCPYCSGTKVLAGFNDLATKQPNLAPEWHPVKNNALTPQKVPEKSALLVWWLGSCGHEWQAKIYSRSNGNNCPKCANRTESGQGDRGKILLSEVRPDVRKFWDKEANGEKLFSELTRGEKKNYWWKCANGHQWQSSPIKIKKTKKGIVCTICSGKEVLTGFNDLATLLPALAEEWHPTKNFPLTPQTIGRGTDSVVTWWLGDCGHEWDTLLTNRTINGNGCPVCSGSRVVEGINDLATLYPKLVEQWHPTKNLPQSPQNVTVSSSFRAWWACDKGHEWDCTVGNRTRFSTGCPSCTSPSSKGEKEVLEHVRNLLPHAKILAGDKRVLDGLELDIYVPDHNLAIEFNGLYWHSEARGKDKNYHYNKWLACKEKGIQLIQIWEDDWKHRKPIVKQLLATKLGASLAVRLAARKTIVREISVDVARVFYNQNHIQGFVAAKHHIALVSPEDAVVAVMSIAILPNNAYSIVRYATSLNVQGGFSKLLRYVERTYEPTKIISFSDNCISDGGLYNKNGFTIDKELAPDYMYVVGGARKHKFGYRLQKFKNDPTLFWEQGYTEKELASLNGLDRIWDAGKVRWVKIISDVEEE